MNIKASLTSVLLAVFAFGAIYPVLSSSSERMRILSATIEELLPYDSENVGKRDVVFRLDVLQKGHNGVQNHAISYGFFIDADRNSATGETGRRLGSHNSPRNFYPLGVDARVSAEYDADGNLFSPLGPVVATNIPAGGTSIPPGWQVVRVEIYSTIDLLPSVNFHWIAYVLEGQQFIRLPASPHSQQRISIDDDITIGPSGAASWATFEITKY
jgi:hypothetical protein